MKKLFLLFMFFLCASLTHTFAQDTNNRLGAQLIYGTDINTIGLGAIAEFPIAEKMVISPSFSFYFPKDNGFAKTNAFELNGNLNYELLNDSKILVYALGGLNYTNYKVKVDLTSIGGGDVASSDGRIGLNLGLGANFDIGKNFLPFGEIKYIVSNFDRLVIAAGVKFDL